MARLTMADVVGIDVAVAQAAQTLQQLQQQQAAMYGGMGGMYMPQYYPHNPDQMGHHHQSGAMFGSILNSGQPHQQARDPLALERAARLYRSAASVCQVCVYISTGDSFCTQFTIFHCVQHPGITHHY